LLGASELACKGRIAMKVVTSQYAPNVDRFFDSRRCQVGILQSGESIFAIEFAFAVSGQHQNARTSFGWC
jgi:hypothetical protein